MGEKDPERLWRELRREEYERFQDLCGTHEFEAECRALEEILREVPPIALEAPEGQLDLQKWRDRYNARARNAAQGICTKFKIHGWVCCPDPGFSFDALRAIPFEEFLEAPHVFEGFEVVRAVPHRATVLNGNGPDYSGFLRDERFLQLEVDTQHKLERIVAEVKATLRFLDMQGAISLPHTKLRLDKAARNREIAHLAIREGQSFSKIGRTLRIRPSTVKSAFAVFQGGTTKGLKERRAQAEDWEKHPQKCCTCQQAKSFRQMCQRYQNHVNTSLSGSTSVFLPGRSVSVEAAELESSPARGRTPRRPTDGGAGP